MAVILLTGVTGAVNQCIASLLIEQGHRLICLIRPRKNVSSTKRLQQILGEEKAKQCTIIDGDITKPLAGVKQSIIEKWQNRIDLAVHGAAAIKFEGQEVWVTNRNGAKNIAKLCQKLRIKQMHYQSTAYVAGDAKTFNEDEIDKGQFSRNRYEYSKLAAENIIREQFRNNFSIYRLGIQIGDSRTGWSPAFEGYYKFFKPFQAMRNYWQEQWIKNPQSCKKHGIFFDADNYLNLDIAINCSMSSKLNLLPCDWLAKILVDLIKIPTQGLTFHLTHPNPPKVADIIKWSLDILKIRGIKRGIRQTSGPTYALSRIQRMSNEKIAPFNAYILHEAIFGNENCPKILGEKYSPPPKIDQALLTKMLTYAQTVKFGYQPKSVKKRGVIMTDFFANTKPTFEINYRQLAEAGVPIEEVNNWIPRSITHPTPLKYGRMTKTALDMMQWLIQTGIKKVLKPRDNAGDDLSQAEVDYVYSREARTYDLKHHWTTRGMDTSWRRMAAGFVLALAKKANQPIVNLDLCTGTGLTGEEIVYTFEDWKLPITVVGIDYNQLMVDQAIQRFAKLQNGSKIKLSAFRGDVTNLVLNGKVQHSLKQFTLESFDSATQVFGIGGVHNTPKAFKNVLQLLKPNGEFFMIDMHRPNPKQSGELPVIWSKMPLFEANTYENTTIPLALKQLWGWHDPTKDFYLLQLTTMQFQDQFWGFEVSHFEVNSERWWLSLPIMPTAKIIVKKIAISEAEAKKRQAILDSLTIV